MREYQYAYHKKTKILNCLAVLGYAACSSDDYNIFDTAIPCDIQKRMAHMDEETDVPCFSAVRPDFANGFDDEGFYNRKVYLYAEVIAPSSCKVIFNILSTENAKVWVNNCLVSIHQNDTGEIHNVALSLTKGRNSVLMERYDTRSSRFSLQITDYAFHLEKDPKAYGKDNPLITTNSLYSIAGSTYLPVEDEFVFMVIANAPFQFLPEFTVELMDPDHQVLSSQKANLCEPAHLDIRAIRSSKINEPTHYFVLCTCYDDTGKEHLLWQSLLVDAFEDIQDPILSYVYHIKDTVDEFTGLQIQGMLEAYNQSVVGKDMVGQYWGLQGMYTLCKSIESQEYDYAFYKKPGIHTIYFRSALDNQIIFMHLRVPAAYQEGIPCPLVMTLSTSEYSGFSYSFPEHAMNEPVIHVDTTGRGFTGGSYIGEASTMEILAFVRRLYTIDDQRIYWIGFSNGGYAVWNMALHHPHIPAAIFPLIGYPYVPNIQNLSNIPCYTLVSDKDYVFTGKTQEINYRLKSYGNYHQSDFSDMIHSHFDQYILSPNILNRLLRHRCNPWPTNILFRTEQNRHLESFWLRLDSIAFGRRYARVHATIVDARKITIQIKNANGLTIKIPPVIDRQRFVIEINGCPVAFSDFQEAEIHLTKKRTWRSSDHQDSILDYRKGNGLLDVYLDRLRIIVPDNASRWVQETAKVVARPNTNGGNGKINVSYPIYMAGNVPEHILHNNLILFDVCGSNPYAERFRTHLPIICTSSGYSYKETFYPGAYVVMQIVANPYYPHLSMLVISANEEKLFKKILLLRKFVIPYQMNGFHPYLNQEALIFDGQSYRGIYEWGLDPENI